MSIDQVIRS